MSGSGQTEPQPTLRMGRRFVAAYNLGVIDAKDDNGAVLLPVKVVPGASRTRYAGQWQSRAKIAVAAPAEKGKANEALRQYLAKLLGVRKQDVSVVSGHSTPLKTIRIERATAAAVLAALLPDRS